MAKTCGMIGVGHLSTRYFAMERFDFLASLRQLAAAAEILAKAGPEDRRADALRLMTLFREYEGTGAATGRSGITSDDMLFAQTAKAALELVGRNEFAASHALLEQARSLLR
jgi:hypothetical protein